jgi:hypothetical protein
LGVVPLCVRHTSSALGGLAPLAAAGRGLPANGHGIVSRLALARLFEVSAEIAEGQHGA